ncbi:MAG: hypothetical protein A2Z29_06865 [Chloroflexi bacterium RBG_16_56_11]|nr:MAG: hypothetical protein A2Z29_06865 [Chloroflexi bacterium RBG_16_56_11]
MTNSGDFSGDYEVVLKVDGLEKDSQTVSLTGHASQTVKFTLQLETAGTYNIDVSGDTVTITVTEKKPEATAPATTPETPVSAETESTQEIASTTTEVAPVPEETQPVDTGTPAPVETATQVAPAPLVPETGAAPTGTNSWLIFLGVAAAGAVIIGVVFFMTRTARRNS